MEQISRLHDFVNQEANNQHKKVLFQLLTEMKLQQQRQQEKDTMHNYHLLCKRSLFQTEIDEIFAKADSKLVKLQKQFEEKI